MSWRIAISTLAAVFLICTSSSFATDRLVPSEYPTIQSAIDAAEDGDTVIISPGTYTGEGNRDIDFKGKAITVGSIDPNDPNIVEATVIECQNVGRGFYLDGCTGAAISGLTITQGYAQAGGGICIEDSNDVTIANCRIIGNVTKAGENETLEKPAANGGDGAGIYCANSSALIRDCDISQNNCGDGGKAFDDNGKPGRGGNGAGLCAERSTVTVRNCTISGNKAGDGGEPTYGGYGGAGGKGGGICCLTLSRVTVEGCTVAGNSTGKGGGWSGGWGSGGAGGAGGGVCCDQGSTLELADCKVLNNWTGPGGNDTGGNGGGICCVSDSPLRLRDCAVEGNIAAPGGTAADGQSLLQSGRGGGIYCRSAVAVDSLIARNSTGHWPGDPVWRWRSNRGDGGGIYCSGNLQMGRCVITRNGCGAGASWHGDGYGGGSGGGVYSKDAVIWNCEISSNSAGDGGVSSNESGADGGNGGGIYAQSLAIANSLIVRNATGNGGNGARGSGAGGDGAGLWCGSGAISNCTIVSNFTGYGSSQGGKGGGVFAKSGVSVKDSIVWENSPEQLFGHDCNNVSCCNLGDEVCMGGSGNISIDPLFIQPGYWTDAKDPNRIVEPNAPNAVWVMGDYHLNQVAAGQALDSPCVDSGSDLAANLGMGKFTTRTDKVGDSGIVDMGYHYIEHIGDLNNDSVINGQDIAILAYQWRQQPAEPSADVAPPHRDGLIDVRDLALLAENWLWPGG